MYSSHHQVGRPRVNKVREGIKNKKTHVQKKNTKSSGLDKLFKLQEELLKEGLNENEYNDYIVNKIDNNKYYYRSLSNKDFELLKKRYYDLIVKESNRYSEIGDIKRINRKRRLDFRRKKKGMILEKKEILIKELFRKMKKSNTIGVLKNTDSLSTDPEKWNETKLVLFSGGRYIESHDKVCVNIYRKITSGFSPHLFNLHSIQSLNQYVLDF